MNLRVNPARGAMLALAVAMTASSASCFGLDGFLFAGEHEDRYALAYDPEWPAQYRVPEAMREVRQLSATDGSGTTTWAVWARQPGADMATAPTIVYSHGQSANIDRYWERVSLLWGELHANVLAYDYPGYGMVPGHATEAGVYATAGLAMQFVQALGAQIDQSRVYQYGFSMGSGPATQLAAFGPHVRGLVLEAPFTSIDALVADGAFVAPRSFVVTASFDNLGKIVRAAQNTTVGVLIVHGGHDTYVQTRYGRQLDQALADAELSGNLPAMRHRFVQIDGADHGEVPCVGPGDDPCVVRPLTSPYFTALRDFLAR